MDMEKPLKFDGECFGLDTDSDFCDPLALVGFGIHGWGQQQPTDQMETASMEEVVGKIKDSTNIAHTPMEELVDLVKLHGGCDGYGEDQVRRILRKTKLIEKRQRAKQRNKVPSQNIYLEQIIAHTPMEPNVVDIKKKKNRLSAQISRDKKKQYYSKLEEENNRLQQQIASLQTQKKQLTTRFESDRKKSLSDSNSSFVSLLLFLGIIFFLDLLRNTTTEKKKANDCIGVCKINLSGYQKGRIQDQIDKFGINMKIDDFDSLNGRQQEGFIPRKIGNLIQWVIQTKF